jgi:hypothetical protein
MEAGFGLKAAAGKGATFYFSVADSWSHPDQLLSHKAQFLDCEIVQIGKNGGQVCVADAKP